MKVKDWFTLLGVAGGVIGLGLVVRGDLLWAGAAVMLGYLVGDTVDGWWARRTGTSNAFGAELDALSDHFAHVFVPGVLFVVGAAQGGALWAGVAACGVLVTTATVRHARFAAAPFPWKAAWCGLPRTISGFAALAWPLAAAPARLGAARPWVGAGVVVVLAGLNLAPVPYRHHRGRALGGWRVLMWAFLLVPPVLFALRRAWGFDAVLAACVLYAVLGWIPVSADERREFRAAYAAWARGDPSASRRT